MLFRHEMRREVAGQKQIKKDALWKPLLRQFRRFVKLTVQASTRYTLNENEAIPVRSRDFAKQLNLPTELYNDERNHFAIFLMVESAKITKQRKLISSCKAPMRPYLSDIRPKFFDIFYENSKKTRVGFFNDPLVQFLWSQFKNVCKNDFNNYVREIHAQDQGAIKVRKFWEDLSDI